MFIENLRHVKNKGRVWFGILLGLIVISLLASFSFMGSSVSVDDSGTNSGPLETAAANAESAAKAADDDKTDMSLQDAACSAYQTLAGYQELYLEDSTDTYEELLTYADRMVEACGSADDPDYSCAYGYQMTAYKALEDAEGCSSVFNASLKHTEVLTESYINDFNTTMTDLGANEQLTTDLQAAVEVIEQMVEESGTEETDTEDGDEEETDGEETPQSLLELVNSLLGTSTIESAD